MKETTTFTLPAGFTLDEMPVATNLENSFGKYSTKYEVKENKVLFTREMTLTRSVLPVEKYSMAKEFFTKIREADQSPIVLIRK